VIPHQANLRIIDAVRERLGVPPEKMYVNIERYGNTSSASIPVALDELVRAGRIKPGDHVGFSAFGGGATWGSSVMRWTRARIEPGSMDGATSSTAVQSSASTTAAQSSASATAENRSTSVTVPGATS